MAHNDSLIFHSTVKQLAKMLSQLDAWLEKSVAFAQKKGFDPETLLTLRLAPDQYALLRQIQAACDAAKFAAARLTGKEPPKHPDTEKTLAEIRPRIKDVVAYLGTYTEKDFEGCAERHVELSFMPGKYVEGADYLRELAEPNFYFHLTTAYAILRHNGIDLGKMDYLGSITLHDK